MFDLFGNTDATNGYQASQNLINTTKAIWRLANAATWDDTYRVLIEEQAILLSDRASTLLRILIETSLENYENADADNWQQYLTLLEDAGTNGIEGAWKRFTEAQNTTIDALEMLSNAATYDAQHIVLDHHSAALLSGTARVILRGSISKQRSEEHFQMAEHLEQILQLLEDAQVYSLEHAWQKYSGN